MASTNSTIRYCFPIAIKFKFKYNFPEASKTLSFRKYVSIYRIEKQGIDHILTLLGT